ncbi:ribonuclease domain-containing protein [Pseudoxanthomonas koreensis]|uniref:ribonuclease domain-containing protein n=1 Tax=Pseudoxanthomonas koreensis TaxID=266061 RepID=UPI001390FE42|nr:ribonuclease domain-containing protein [Pseudoxanthomonas koreensis]KAF1693374.1 ribonuclease [Pseudoxanthomonas koreensis]
MSRPSRHQKPRSRALPRLLLAIVAVLLVAWLLLPSAPAPQTPAPTANGTQQASVPARAAALPGFLPAEAAAVISAIQTGTRLPHAQDGSVFGNRERRLPTRAHGWYREYTVPTPGLGHRGARRIVTGGDPPSEWYYTADHYETFRAFEPPATGVLR